MNTKKKRITEKQIRKEDIGIKVSELIKLLDVNNLITKDLLKELEIEKIKSHFIPIKGATALYESQLILKESFLKVDLLSKLKDISFYDDDEFAFNFNNVNDSLNFPNIKKISALPLYSAHRDFFGNLFNMDKYAKSLIANNQKDIVNKNLELLKQVKKIEKRYRLILNKEDQRYYLRAIVSKDNYYDYNNSVAVVVGLITLYSEMKKSGIDYSLRFCEYNESYIRMIFDTNETQELEGIGSVKNIVEISNDEIKREALKFYGICSIIYNDKKVQGEIFIKPTDIKTKIFSIKHNQKPETAIKTLAEIDNTSKVHTELYKDIQTIKNIKNTEQIKFIVKRKIENSKNEDLKNYQSKIISETTTTSTKNIIDLLKLFNKIQILADEDIEASEYIRFVFYEALINKR